MDKHIRNFSLSAIHNNAEDYYLMIDWRTTRIKEPLATRALTEDDINQCIYEKLIFSCRESPCHTQAMERTVKLVTESLSRACSQFAREELIVSTLTSMQRIPAFLKKDFVSNR